jgi:ABC-type branched-subunit amino acid transport system permease subunit
MQWKHALSRMAPGFSNAARAAIREGPVEVVAVVVLTTLFAAALAVIFGFTALRRTRTP